MVLLDLLTADFFCCELWAACGDPSCGDHNLRGSEQKEGGGTWEQKLPISRASHFRSEPGVPGLTYQVSSSSILARY